MVLANLGWGGGFAFTKMNAARDGVLRGRDSRDHRKPVRGQLDRIYNGNSVPGLATTSKSSCRTRCVRTSYFPLSRLGTYSNWWRLFLYKSECSGMSIRDSEVGSSHRWRVNLWPLDQVVTHTAPPPERIRQPPCVIEGSDLYRECAIKATRSPVPSLLASPSQRHKLTLG